MLKAGWSKDQILVGGKRFFSSKKCPHGSRVHPVCYAMVNKVLAWGKEARV
jgi:hypothetical protein